MEKKNQPGVETPEIKTRIPLWLYPSTLEAVDRAMGRDNCKSRSEFIENAIRFYAGYLSGEDAVQFLPAALVSALRATVELSEDRTARLLFKLTVEISMMMNVLAAGLEIDASQLDALRWQCVQAVKKTNGSITFKNVCPVRKASFHRENRTAAGHEFLAGYQAALCL